MKTPLKIVFAGSPDFAKNILSDLSKVPYISIIKVLTQPDKPKGRGKQLLPTPVKTMAEHLNISVETPTKKGDITKLLHILKPDIVLVVGYGIILEAETVNTFHCINIHASLLPQYRGASPIQASLLNNDDTTGITLIRMTEGLDEGPILRQSDIPILKKDTFSTLHDRLSQLGADMAADHIQEITITDVFPSGSKQNDAKASYCHKIQKSDLLLKKSDSPQVKLGKIKAFSPKPGAYIMHQDKRIKILDAVLKRGLLIPLTVQPEGKNSMSYKDYCLGNPQGLENL